jgi:pimeloyl-ACP methyl ester carboxylesterase
MKRILIVALLLGVLTAKAQDITGSWLGTLPVNANVNLRLVFNISHNADSSYSASFDSPDQKAFNLNCGKTYRAKDSVFIDMPVINGSYKGKWNGQDGIIGIFKQNGRTLPLSLSRITPEQKMALSGPAEKVRPQTPKPPFNYYTEDVEYDNAAKTIHYGATFTRPNGAGKFPAVIIISGSGTQDRNGSMMNGHKPYWVLADYLTKNGIAVLRVDDRGAGKSSLGPDPAKLTSVDFSYDVENSLNYLESRQDVDKKHIGLIGHSEGGMIAPMVAVRRKDVSFIVLWAGPGVSGAKILAKQQAESLKLAGLSDEALAAYAVLNQHIMDTIALAPSVSVLDTMISAYFTRWKARQTPAVISATLATGNNLLGKDIFSIYNLFYTNAWLHFFVGYDPAPTLSRVKCPVLALAGAKDKQVDPEQNLSAIKAALIKGGNKDFEVTEIPNLNHLFQDADTGYWTEYESIDETVSPAAMKIISDWIKLHTK